MQILQTILLPKNKFTLEEVNKYLKENNFKNSKIDITNNYYRARQKDPRYLKKKGFSNVKTLINKKTGIHKIYFFNNNIL
jgi:DNA gyrase/topoisomerase IV subunit B